jgi:hypothetical protein
MRIYARGHSDLDKEKSLVRQFIRLATPELISAAISAVASGVSMPEGETRIWLRVQRLYEWVLATYQERPPEERQLALQSFGFWIMAPSVDRRWAMKVLAQTLRVTEGKITPQRQVLGWLALNSSSDPLGASQALQEMVRPNAAVRFIPDSDIRIILANAVAAGGEARQTALAIDNSFSLLGIHEYHDVFRTAGA